MAASSEELASQAEQLQSAIEFFKVSDEPGKTSNLAHKARAHAQVAHSAVHVGKPAAKPSHAPAQKIPDRNSHAGVMIELDHPSVPPVSDQEFERF
jgi:hypothetical protein